MLQASLAIYFLGRVVRAAFHGWPDFALAVCLVLSAIGFSLPALGALEIRFDEKGADWRNWTYCVRRLNWEMIREVRMFEELIRTDDGRILGRSRCLEITGNSLAVRITGDWSGPPGWRETLLTLLREKANRADFIGLAPEWPEDSGQSSKDNAISELRVTGPTEE